MNKSRVLYQTSLDGEFRAFMIQQLIKYLLFIRGQVPCVYDELVQCVTHFQQEPVNATNKRRRLPVRGSSQKAVKCVATLEELFQVSLTAIFSLRVKQVALVFGSSMMSPREAILVNFDDEEVEGSRTMTSAATASYDSDMIDVSVEKLHSSTSSSSPLSREKLMHLCAQKLVRALFTCSMKHFACALPVTKLHIAVLAERQSTRIPGFIPKQQFKLRLPNEKRGIRTNCLTICSNGASRMQLQQKVSQHLLSVEKKKSDETSIVANDIRMRSSGVQTSTNTCNSDMVWYVLEKPIVGFSEVLSIIGDQ